MKAIRVNYRLEVEPKGLGDFGGVRMSDRLIEPDPERRAKRYEEACEEMAEAIKRYVEGVEHVEVKYDTEYLCTDCYYQAVSEDEECLCPVAKQRARAALAKARGKGDAVEANR